MVKLVAVAAVVAITSCVSVSCSLGVGLQEVRVLLLSQSMFLMSFPAFPCSLASVLLFLSLLYSSSSLPSSFFI